MTLFVGCDLGTTGTKAGVVSLDGQLLAEAFEEVPLHHPAPGLVEQDLEEIEASAHRTIRAALDRAGGDDEVAAVSLSGQMSGIGTIDERFAPATHYDSWLDTRCAPVIEELEAEAERITAISGCPPTYAHGPKIRWWQQRRPETFARIHRFVTPTAFVAGRLCGLAADHAYIDRTHLHFSNLADNEGGQWSQELIDLLEVDERVLPRIAEPTDVIGMVTAAGAAATGLPEGVPVAAGAGDTSAAALGAGVVRPGMAFDVAGTASVFAVCVDRFAPDLANQMLMATAGIAPGTWVSLAFINGGGLALQWFRDEVVPELADDPDAYARLDQMAAKVEPGAGGLLWHPHFQGQVLPPGPHARGSWVGVTSGHTHGHLFRAMLEGIAFEYARWADAARDAADAGAITEARALGGGAASEMWNQIKADVLGIDWVPLERQECGVLGNALVAATASGYVDDIAATAEEWQRLREPVQPDPARHRAYQDLRPAADRLAASLDPVFTALARARGSRQGDEDDEG